MGKKAIIFAIVVTIVIGGIILGSKIISTFLKKFSEKKDKENEERPNHTNNEDPRKADKQRKMVDEYDSLKAECFKAYCSTQKIVVPNDIFSAAFTGQTGIMFLLEKIAGFADDELLKIKELDSLKTYFYLNFYTLLDNKITGLANKLAHEEKISRIDLKSFCAEFNLPEEAGADLKYEILENQISRAKTILNELRLRESAAISDKISERYRGIFAALKQSVFTELNNDILENETDFEKYKACVAEISKTVSKIIS